jgi:hypothetical protein
MRSAAWDLILLFAVGSLLLFAFDYADAIRLVLPMYQLMKEYILFVIACLAVLIGFGIVGRQPRIGSR